MVDSGVIGVSEISDISVGIISNIGQIALWLQGLGLVLIIWLIFQIIFFYINKKRIKELYTIKKDMQRIEGKIDKILKKH